MTRNQLRTCFNILAHSVSPIHCQMYRSFGPQSMGLKQLAASYRGNTDKKLVCFPVQSDSIDVLPDPKTFYSRLKKLIARSRKRVILSSLYLGTDKLEQNLIHTLSSHLNENRNLRASIVVDFNRGQRLSHRDDPNSSSRGLLRDLAYRANVFFFRSPAFNQTLYRYLILPIRTLNESVSTQHIKCYIGDDDLILSGANLSADYFTNRQDRYIYVRNCPELCDYLEKVINLVGKVSFKLYNNDDLTIEKGSTFNPYDTAEFIKTFKHDFHQIQKEYKTLDQFQVKNMETLIIPTLQMSYLEVTEDSDLTSILLSLSRKTSKTSHLISGYFNLTKDYINLITHFSSSTLMNVLAASEEVNGFYQGSGLKKFIPSIYTQKSKDFLTTIQKSAANVDFYTYKRDKWTFHAKGFWTYLNDGSYVTSIGSSNYGYRSVERDLELQFLVATKNQNLIDKLENERAQLWKYATLIKTPNDLPQVPLAVKLASTILESYF